MHIFKDFQTAKLFKFDFLLLLVSQLDPQIESFSMQSKSLSFQIANKGKKHMYSQEPTFFSEIPYSNVRQINYLTDLEQRKKNIDFPICQFEKDFGDEAPINQFDMLADRMYKKIMQKGSLQQKKPMSKRKKKTKNPYQYDYEDVFINDEEVVNVKKTAQLKYENFKCLNYGIQQFYNSELYKSNLLQLQEQSKKRTTDIQLDAQELEQMKKKIKENINLTHNRIKEQIDIDLKTGITQHINNEAQKEFYNFQSQNNKQQMVFKQQNHAEMMQKQIVKKEQSNKEDFNQQQMKDQNNVQLLTQQKRPKRKTRNVPIQKPKIQKKVSRRQKAQNKGSQHIINQGENNNQQKSLPNQQIIINECIHFQNALKENAQQNQLCQVEIQLYGQTIIEEQIFQQTLTNNINSNSPNLASHVQHSNSHNHAQQISKYVHQKAQDLKINHVQNDQIQKANKDLQLQQKNNQNHLLSNQEQQIQIQNQNRDKLSSHE